MERYHIFKLGLAILFYAAYCIRPMLVNGLRFNDLAEKNNRTKQVLKSEDYDVYYQGAVDGVPGDDFPILSYIPRTSFNCRDFESGYYADLDTDCQVFHICEEGKKISFLCPNGTVFDQSDLICEWWYKVNCSDAPSLYEESAERLREDLARKKASRRVLDGRERNHGAVMRIEESSSISAKQNGKQLEVSPSIRNIVTATRINGRVTGGIGTERTVQLSHSNRKTNIPLQRAINQIDREQNVQQKRFNDAETGNYVNNLNQGNRNRGSDKDLKEYHLQFSGTSPALDAASSEEFQRVYTRSTTPASSGNKFSPDNRKIIYKNQSNGNRGRVKYNFGDTGNDSPSSTLRPSDEYDLEFPKHKSQTTYDNTPRSSGSLNKLDLSKVENKAEPKQKSTSDFTKNDIITRRLEPVESDELQVPQETAAFATNSYNSIRSSTRKYSTANLYPNHRSTYSDLKQANFPSTKSSNSINSVTPQYITTQSINNGKPFIGSTVGVNIYNLGKSSPSSVSITEEAISSSTENSPFSADVHISSISPLEGRTKLPKIFTSTSQPDISSTVGSTFDHSTKRIVDHATVYGTYSKNTATTPLPGVGTQVRFNNGVNKVGVHLTKSIGTTVPPSTIRQSTDGGNDHGKSGHIAVEVSGASPNLNTNNGGYASTQFPPLIITTSEGTTFKPTYFQSTTVAPEEATGANGNSDYRSGTERPLIEVDLSQNGVGSTFLPNTKPSAGTIANLSFKSPLIDDDQLNLLPTLNAGTGSSLLSKATTFRPTYFQSTTVAPEEATGANGNSDYRSGTERPSIKVDFSKNGVGSTFLPNTKPSAGTIANLSFKSPLIDDDQLNLLPTLNAATGSSLLPKTTTFRPKYFQSTTVAPEEATGANGNSDYRSGTERPSIEVNLSQNGVGSTFLPNTKPSAGTIADLSFKSPSIDDDKVNLLPTLNTATRSSLLPNTQLVSKGTESTKLNGERNKSGPKTPLEGGSTTKQTAATAVKQQIEENVYGSSTISPLLLRTGSLNQFNDYQNTGSPLPAAGEAIAFDSATTVGVAKITGPTLGPKGSTGNDPLTESRIYPVKSTAGPPDAISYGKGNTPKPDSFRTSFDSTTERGGVIAGSTFKPLISANKLTGDAVSNDNLQYNNNKVIPPNVVPLVSDNFAQTTPNTFTKLSENPTRATYLPKVNSVNQGVTSEDSPTYSSGILPPLLPPVEGGRSALNTSGFYVTNNAVYGFTSPLSLSAISDYTESTPIVNVKVNSGERHIQQPQITLSTPKFESPFTLSKSETKWPRPFQKSPNSLDQETNPVTPSYVNYKISSARPFKLPKEVTAAPTLPTPFTTASTQVSSVYENIDNMINVLKEIADTKDQDYSSETPRPGLVIPPSAGPQTLHTLAAYFANALDGVMAEREKLTGEALDEESKEKLTGLLTQMTMYRYKELFKGKEADEEKDTGTTILPDDILEGEDSSYPIETPALRQLARNFSLALSSYLDDPEAFRRDLENFRPTEPPPVTEDRTEANVGEEELLNFSDADSKSSFPPVFPTVPNPSPTWAYIIASKSPSDLDLSNSLNPDLNTADTQSFVPRFNNLAANDKEFGRAKGGSENKKELPGDHWTTSPGVAKLWQSTLSINPVAFNEHFETTESIPHTTESYFSSPGASVNIPQTEIQYELRSLPPLSLNSTQVRGILIDFMNTTKADESNRLQRLLKKLNTTEGEFLDRMKEIESNPLTKRLILLLISECGTNATADLPELSTHNNSDEILQSSHSHSAAVSNNDGKSLLNSNIPAFVDTSLQEDDQDTRALQLLNSLYTIASKFGK